jgi:hypothetical protein
VSIEGCTYRLSTRGKAAGKMTITSGERGRVAVTIARMQFQGALGSSSRTHTSRAHALRHHSLAWREESEEAGVAPFDVTFDVEAGIVRANRGRQDTATIPHLLPYRDPLSLLRELRAITAAGDAGPPLPLRIPMLGKEVVVVRSEIGEVSALGERVAARTFTLYPGGGSVSVALAAPHPIVRLLQRLDDGTLEATLIDRRLEANMPGLDAGDDEAAGDEKRRARRRRPRKRGS